MTTRYDEPGPRPAWLWYAAVPLVLLALGILLGWGGGELLARVEVWLLDSGVVLY